MLDRRCWDRTFVILGLKRAASKNRVASKPATVDGNSGTNGDACRPRASLASQNACQQESCVDRLISTTSPGGAATPMHVPTGRFQHKKLLCAAGKHARRSKTRRALVSSYPRWQSAANTAHTTLRHFIVLCARDKPIATLESIQEHSSSNSPYE